MLRTALLLTLLAAIPGCAGDNSSRGGEEGLDSATAGDLAVDTLISTASALVGDPTDLEIAANGMILVLDRLNAQVHRIAEDGAYLGAFASQGAGPGELDRPTALARGRGDTLWIVDTGNGRLQAFTVHGEHVRAGSTHAWMSFPSHVTRAGHLIASSAGQDTILAAAFNGNGERIRSFGIAPAPFGRGPEIRMTELAAMIADGEVPPVFRNTAFPFATPSGDVWLSRVVDGELERYDASGTDGTGPEVTIRVDAPEMPAIREQWIATNRAPESRGVSVLRYFADIYATDLHVWVLLNQPPDAPTVLLRFGRDGQSQGRWTLPQVVGASSLAVDTSRDRLILGIGDVAQVVSLPLPI